MSSMQATRDGRALIDKAFSILVSFGPQASTGLGVSELARRSELSKSTAFRVLTMLQRSGVVERAGGAYRLGQRLHELGAAVYCPEHDRIRETLTPFLADLYELTHQTVHLATLHGTDVVYLAKLYGHRRVPSPSRVGARVAAHCTAVGKALLAHDQDAFEALLAAPLTARTPRSVIEPQQLAAQLMQVRRDGIAVEIEEAAPGLSCIAVPVFGAGGRAVAALSVSGRAGGIDPRIQAPALRRVGHAASVESRRARIGATVPLPRGNAS